MAEGAYGVARLGYRYVMASLSLTLGSLAKFYVWTMLSRPWGKAF